MDGSSGRLYLVLCMYSLCLHGHSLFSQIMQVAAAFGRDLVLCLVLTFLAIGTTIAFSLFAYGNGVDIAMHVASYFWMASALVAWWRVTIFLVDEAYGDSVPKFLSPFPTPIEKRQALLAPVPVAITEAQVYGV